MIFTTRRLDKYRIVKNGLGQYIIQEKCCGSRIGEYWEDFMKPFKTFDKAKRCLDTFISEIKEADRQKELLNTLEVLYET